MILLVDNAIIVFILWWFTFLNCFIVFIFISSETASTQTQASSHSLALSIVKTPCQMIQRNISCNCLSNGQYMMLLHVDSV